MADRARTASDDWLAEHRDDLVTLVRELVSRPSENRPPHGDEAACQEFATGRWLSDCVSGAGGA